MIPNILDFIMLIFVAACYFLSSLRGGVKQIFSFFVIVVSFVGAGKFYNTVAAVLPRKVFPESFAEASGWVVVFLAGFGAISLLGKFGDDLFKRLHFGGTDRFISIFVGLLKGVFLACVAMIIIIITYPADTETISKSVAAPYLVPVAQGITKILPREDQEEFTVKVRELRDLWGAREGEEEQE